jgi:hypothetical protein
MQSLIAPDTITANKLQFAAMNLTYLNSMPVNCVKKSTSRKEVFLMLAFLKVLYDQIQKKFIEEHAMAKKTTNLGLDTGNLLRCI